MTWSAVALGVFQLVFLWNLVLERAPRRSRPRIPWRATTLEWATTLAAAAGQLRRAAGRDRPPYRYEEEQA